MISLRKQWPRFQRPVAGVFLAAAGLGLLTAILIPFTDSLLPVALLFLLATLVISAVWGYAVGIVAAIAADLLVNFFFVPPLHTFTVQSPENVVALLVFLAVAVVGSSMLALLRRQAYVAEARRAEAAMLLNLTQELAHAVSPRDALNRICTVITRSLGARGCAILRRDGDRWAVVAGASETSLSQAESAMASEALRTGEIIRLGGEAASRPHTANQRAEPRLTFVPFRASTREPGALRITGKIEPPRLVDGGTLLRAFADEAAFAVQRARLAEEAGRVEALERADEFKTAILSSVSHDLRSPLTAIKASVGTLRDPDLEWSPADRESLLETIESQTDRLTATVTNLLEMSRLEGGAVRVELESIDAALLLEDVRGATRLATGGRTVSIDAAAETWMRSDYALLFQALINLIENAAKYSTPGGGIRLGASRDRHTVAISVRDDGPGIPEADLPHIFEKFYRGSGSSRAKGTGLGLSIVQAMVRACGGSVRVESSPQGTVFTIAMPAALPAAS